MQNQKPRAITSQLRDIAIIAFVFVVIAGFFGCIFANLITKNVREKQKQQQEEIEYLLKKLGEKELSTPSDEPTGNLYKKEDFNKVINFIKDHEGFVDTPYYCPGGKLTIGYGHVIKTEEYFTKISKAEAHELVRNDLNAAISSVHRSTNLRGTRLLAMSHFVYAKGSGTFERSGLKDAINSGAVIDSIVMEFGYYRTPDGTKITNERMKSIRRWELNLYYGRL